MESSIDKEQSLQASINRDIGDQSKSQQQISAAMSPGESDTISMSQLSVPFEPTVTHNKKKAGSIDRTVPKFARDLHKHDENIQTGVTKKPKI